MMKKKKQSRSQSNSMKTLQQSSDSSLLSIFRSKLKSGKDLKNMLRSMRSKTTPGLSSQSRIVICPKCHKLLQEPIDATSYKCSGCNSILQAKSWELENNDDSIPEALLSIQNWTEVESAEDGSKTPIRSTYREYNLPTSPSVETVYKPESSNIRREWMRRADEFRDSDVFSSARSSEWTQHEELPRVPSSVYDYGYSSPFHVSEVSASDQFYYHHQPNQIKEYGREGWFQESPISFPGETSDGKYYHWYSQYRNLYETSSSATPHRSVYTELSYQGATTPLRSPYSDHSVGFNMARKSVVKRYVLPLAGGAPFVTCSYCLELLQLPQVSLHGKYKRYQVRCGSCSGVLKFSSREKADSVLESPSFMDSGKGSADETVAIHQDSASKGHDEIYPDDNHLSSSDNSSGDEICKSTDSVMLETFEDKDIKEDLRRKVIDSNLEALQPSLSHKLREEQPASTENIGETLRIHLDLSEEAHTEKSTKMDNNIFGRDRCDLEEPGYDKNEIIKPEEMFGDGSDESLVPVYKNERISESNEEAERVAEKPVSHNVEHLYKKENICETHIVSDNTGGSDEFDWEETQENEKYGGENTWEEIMGDKPELHLEKSQYIEDYICDGSSSYGETAVKEDTDQISNIFSDVMSATPQSPLKSLVKDNQRFIEHPEQSGEAIVTIFRIHEEQSKYKYENISERQELDKTTSEKLSYELEESRYETKETLETVKVSEEAETGEETSVSNQMDSPNENVENSYERLEPVYLEGTGYQGGRTWVETMGDRAGLHLEDYENNYENNNKPFEWSSEGAPIFHINEYEPGRILEPEEDAQGRSKSSSRGSFNDHESSEESAVFHEYEDDKPDHSQFEYENSGEKQELNNTIFDIVSSELHECRYETNDTFEPGQMVGVGSVVSLEKASETIIGETGEERSGSHQMAPQNENIEISYGAIEPVYLEGSEYASERAWPDTMGDGVMLQLKEYQSNPHEWTSERALTFRLHEYELGTMPEPEENAKGKSISSSTDFFNDHESSKERVVAHEEEAWLVDENKTEELRTMPEPSLHLEQCVNESTKLKETFEWTERIPTFRLHESELGTMLEPDEDAYEKSESSLRSSFNDYGSSKERHVFHKNEPWLVDDYEIKELKASVMAKDGPSLQLENCRNEKMELGQTLEPRDDTFRLSLDDRLEQERMTFHLEMSQDKQKNLRQAFKQGEAEEDIPEFGSMVSSEGHESPSKIAEVNSEAEYEIFGNHLKHLQKEKEKSGLTSEAYAHFYNTTEPSEIVGLRHALYQTQTSPLRSPLNSPIHTPIGSPLHYLMSSQMRSPIASSMHSHIVSPLRSPINTSGSLSDVLFFGKKT